MEHLSKKKVTKGAIKRKVFKKKNNNVTQNVIHSLLYVQLIRFWFRILRKKENLSAFFPQ